MPLDLSIDRNYGKGVFEEPVPGIILLFSLSVVPFVHYPDCRLLVTQEVNESIRAIKYLFALQATNEYFIPAVGADKKLPQNYFSPLCGAPSHSF